MNDHNSKTALFLMELILMVLLFSLCAAVCMRLFAGAQNMSTGSRELNAAVAEAESAAEAFKAAKGSVSAAAALVGATDMEDSLPGWFALDYDGEWTPGAAPGVYRLVLTEHDGYADIDVRNVAKDETIFALTVKAVS